MSSTVKSRPNHYETLGLKPGATAEEIGRAFAREIGLFRPRPFGGTAALGLAYETLRDPVKRRAYDESIGLRRAPPPASSPPQPYVTNAIFIRPPSYAGAMPKPQAQAVAEPVRAEPVAPLAAAEPVAAEARPLPFLIAPERAAAAPAEAAQAALSRLLPKIAVRPSPSSDDASDEPPIELNRTLAIAGSLILAVGALGAWAGSQAGQAAEDARPANGVTLRVPKARPALAAVAEPAGMALGAPAATAAPRFERAPVLRRAAPPAAAATPAPPPTTEQSAAEQNRFARESIAQATSAEPLALDDSSPAPVAASMPLSDATVARTIQRIGYSCGQVASTVPGEGAGVFTVTCSSGETFQAKPQRGRYHFRRIGR